jgi:hypothetical protein
MGGGAAGSNSIGDARGTVVAPPCGIDRLSRGASDRGRRSSGAEQRDFESRLIRLHHKVVTIENARDRLLQRSLVIPFP